MNDSSCSSSSIHGSHSTARLTQAISNKPSRLSRAPGRRPLSISRHCAGSPKTKSWNMTVPDPDHSLDEDRSITVGLSHRGRLLIVAHTERGDRIRIISARELTRTEIAQYEEGF